MAEWKNLVGFVLILCQAATARILDTADVQIIRNPNPVREAQFGWTLRSGPDGFVTSAPGDHVAYTFDQEGILVHTLRQAFLDGDDQFGNAVGTIQGDILVGDQTDGTPPNEFLGSVYRFDGTTGNFKTKILNPTPGNFSVYFGGSLAEIGGNLAVGHTNFSTALLTEVGAVHLFNGSTNALIHTFNNPDATTEDRNKQFGTVLASAGSRLIVGAPNTWSGDLPYAGAVHIFDSDPASPSFGNLLLTLKQTDPKIHDFFGHLVVTDGNRMLVGIQTQTEDLRGKVLLYDIDDQSPTYGSLLHTFDNPGNDTDEFFGISGSFIPGSILIGAGGPPKGSVYVYDSITYDLKQRVESPEPPPMARFTSDDFGRQLGVLGDKVVVSAPSYEVPQRGSGTIYVYGTKPKYEHRIQFDCREPIDTLLADLDVTIQVYRGTTDATCCNPRPLEGATPLVSCPITSDLIPDSAPPISCEDLVDLLALEVGTCFDQVSGVLEWRVVSGGSLIVGSDESFLFGVTSSEITDLEQDEIIPLEQCRIGNLGDGQPGNELNTPFASGLAIMGERWKKTTYDSNQDCFIDSLDLINLLESARSGIDEPTLTLEEFSVYWHQ